MVSVEFKHHVYLLALRRFVWSCYCLTCCFAFIVFLSAVLRSSCFSPLCCVLRVSLRCVAFFVFLSAVLRSSCFSPLCCFHRVSVRCVAFRSSWFWWRTAADRAGPLRQRQPSDSSRQEYAAPSHGTTSRGLGAEPSAPPPRTTVPQAFGLTTLRVQRWAVSPASPCYVHTSFRSDHHKGYGSRTEL